MIEVESEDSSVDSVSSGGSIEYGEEEMSSGGEDRLSSRKQHKWRQVVDEQ